MTNPTTTEPHTAYPAHPTRAVDEDGMLATCAGCGATIRYRVRENPVPGQPKAGWAHTRTPARRARPPRPVRPYDLVTMAERLSDAARERAYLVADGHTEGVEYERARRCHERRFAALRRLAEALETQGGAW